MMDERETGLDGAFGGPADGGTAEGTTAEVAKGNGGPTRDQVMEALRNVYDPELGINIVDLGLVYDVEVRGGEVDVTYTLTTMGCPIGPLIEQQMEQYLLLVQGVDQVHAEMVLRPPWSPEMMSEEAKAALGYF